jgi:hypothetical protein
MFCHGIRNPALFGRPRKMHSHGAFLAFGQGEPTAPRNLYCAPIANTQRLEKHHSFRIVAAGGGRGRTGRTQQA